MQLAEEVVDCYRTVNGLFCLVDQSQFSPKELAGGKERGRRGREGRGGEDKKNEEERKVRRSCSLSRRV